MIEDDETLQMYIEESLEHLSDIESDLLAIEEGGKDIDIDLVNKYARLKLLIFTHTRSYDTCKLRAISDLFFHNRLILAYFFTYKYVF